MFLFASSKKKREKEELELRTYLDIAKRLVPKHQSAPSMEASIIPIVLNYASQYDELRAMAQNGIYQ